MVKTSTKNFQTSQILMELQIMRKMLFSDSDQNYFFKIRNIKMYWKLLKGKKYEWKLRTIF